MNFLEKYNIAVSRCKGSKLCIGLDTDINQLPKIFKANIDSVLQFNTEIINQTNKFCAAYKVNFAFYESLGDQGFQIISDTIKQIPKDIITIADAKRGDIGNTSSQYANAVFGKMDFDSITVAPYMGIDSVKPFFEYENKTVFILALTSNPGSNDFQRLIVGDKPLYKIVIEKYLNAFGNNGELGFVVGATHPEELSEIREMVGLNVPLLIPGVGSQGGSAEQTISANNNGVALINVSRGICGQSKEDDFLSVVRTNTEYYSKILI